MKKVFMLLLLLAEINLHAQHCGPLDSTFGSSGTTFGVTVTDNDRWPYSRNLIVQPDKKIIQTVTVSTSARYEFGLIRYKADGKLDSAFGTNGRVTAQVGSGESQAEASALQSDGKIVSAGSATSAGYIRSFALVRYHSNGKVDSSFGLNGRVITQVGTSYDYATAIAIQPDGKIIVVGASFDAYYTGAFAILKYNNNGSLDNSFGQNGKIITHPGPLISYIGNTYFGRHADEYASAVLIQSDGKIVVAGKSYSYSGCWDYYGGIYCNPALAVLRFNNNGTVDSSFGINGKVADSVKLLYASSAVLQNDEKIVIAGSGYSGGFVTARFKTNGSPDSSFGNNGISITQTVTGGNPWAASVAIQPDEKIVVAGTTANNFTVARYLTDGNLDNTFNGNGVLVFDIGQPGSVDEVSGVGIQDNRIIVGGRSREFNVTSIAIVRLLENGQAFTPVIAANGPLQFCDGSSVKLSANYTGTVQWYRDNFLINGATDTVLLVFNGGSYKVKVTNANGCGFSAPVVVSATTPFIPAIWTNGPTNFCIGDSVTLFSNAQSEWYKDGLLINGSTGYNFNAKESGVYTAKTKVNECESSASNAIGVAVNSAIPPPPVISAGGATTFCDGENVLLSSDALSGNQWYKDGTLIGGATAATLKVVAAGTYTAKVSLSGCQSSMSNSIVATVIPLPVKPIINWSTPEFTTASGYARYQWYLNNNLLAGVDTNVYRPTQTGTYKVVVTGNNNCINTSDSFVLRVLAVAEITIGDAKLRYYPNPVQSVLNIEINNSNPDKLEATIYDALGKLVHKQALLQGHNQLAMQMLPMGFYQLVIHNKVKSVAVKLIKAR
ncbi:MAG TPA: T9SS type A sorting domain-containing protein [Chitinophagaceae bacterium]|nr:T9SS type A sorting domain-containing protein [Chitinophagaceae bacterium]